MREISVRVETKANIKDLPELGKRLAALSTRQSKYDVIAFAGKTGYISDLQASGAPPSDVPAYLQAIKDTVAVTTNLIIVTVAAAAGTSLGDHVLKRIADECFDWWKERRKGRAQDEDAPPIRIFRPDGTVYKTIKQTKSKGKSAGK